MALNELSSDNSKSCFDVLEFYFSPYRQFSEMDNRVCLCGVLAGEFVALPADVQEVVQEFFTWHHAWLEDLITRGKE